MCLRRSSPGPWIGPHCAFLEFFTVNIDAEEETRDTPDLRGDRR
jgi:hypothetical protein